jgi:c(7)-type cytochrome triheme protein
MLETSAQHSLANGASRARDWQRRISRAVVFAACGGFFFHYLFDARPSALSAELSSRGPDADFSRFDHASAQHARMPCLLCHRRETNAPQPRLPGHTPCAACHAPQFAESNGPICAICHPDPASGSVRSFPPLGSFNVLFDHATHMRGAARPTQGCVSCHTRERRGVALSIPAGLDAHATCFACHAPRAQAGGRDISSCAVCHRAGGYVPTPEWRRAYSVNFSHAEHTRKGLSCTACHSVRAGMPQSRQVASPAAAQHHVSARALSCATCHDNRRAFGGDDFSDCTRCHQGSTWRF